MKIPVVIKIGEQTWSAAYVDQDVETPEVLHPCEECTKALEEDIWIVEEPGYPTVYMCGACATYIFAGQPGRYPDGRWQHAG